jgi:hypothetical protein
MTSSELSDCLKIITAYFLFLMFYSISIVYKINKNTFWLQFFFFFVKLDWIFFSINEKSQFKKSKYEFFLKESLVNTDDKIKRDNIYLKYHNSRIKLI